jgi:hypothetical protein
MGEKKQVSSTPLDTAWRQSKPRFVPAPRALFAGTRLITPRQHPSRDE